jgi:hypothetical protein
MVACMEEVEGSVDDGWVVYGASVGGGVCAGAEACACVGGDVEARPRVVEGGCCCCHRAGCVVYARSVDAGMLLRTLRETCAVRIV